MSIRDNVAFAPRLLGWPRKRIEGAVRESLEGAALWDEVYIASELERMGDYAVRIARMTSTCSGYPTGSSEPSSA